MMRSILSCIVAMTLMFAGSGIAVGEPPTTQPRPMSVLIIAGGSSHDFKKWFEDYDSTFLTAAGCSVTSTEDPAVAIAEISKADVAIVSTNDPAFNTPKFREALFSFHASGKGLILLHPATWFNFEKWQEYNAKLVGGGTRSHDAIAPFSVTVVEKDHPVMAGVPADFDVTDELYHINPDPAKLPAGTVPIEVLAQTSPSRKFKVPHPSVWIPQTDAGRIVCIALGHDGRVHQLPAFQKIMINAVKWVGRSPNP